MKLVGLLYIIIGIVALIGAAGVAFIILSLNEAIALINTPDVSLPPDTDVTALRDSARAVGALITVGLAWLICVILSALISIYFGIVTLKGKKRTESRGR